MIRVCFAGVSGWTAAALAPAIDAALDMVLAAGVSRSAAGQRLEEFGASGDGLVHSSVADALATNQVDVLIDFTSASAVKDNVHAAVQAGVHAVIGSSGLTAADFEELDSLARERDVGVFAAGNFSIMAAVLARSAQLAADHLESWEILDYASQAKPTSPAAPRRNWLKPSPKSTHRRWPFRSILSKARSRHEVLRWPARRSTQFACPASSSPPRSSSVARANV